MDEQRQSDQSDSEEATATGVAGPVDWQAHIEFLRGLTEVIQQENLSEVIVENAGVRLTLKAAAQPVAAQQVAHYSVLPGSTLPAPLVDTTGAEHEARHVPEPAVAPSNDKNLVPIVAPMVGVFYRSQSPDDPPFVEVGDHVEAGQTVALVEAMKTFNEIASETEGTVSAIMAQSGDLVETGSTLMMVRKS